MYKHHPLISPCHLCFLLKETMEWVTHPSSLKWFLGKTRRVNMSWHAGSTQCAGGVRTCLLPCFPHRLTCFQRTAGVWPVVSDTRVCGLVLYYCSDSHPKLQLCVGDTTPSSEARFVVALSAFFLLFHFCFYYL